MTSDFTKAKECNNFCEQCGDCLDCDNPHKCYFYKESIKMSEIEPRDGDITFTVKTESQEIIKLCHNGDIFVKGKLIENDKELTNAMREFLAKANQDAEIKSLQAAVIGLSEALDRQTSPHIEQFCKDRAREALAQHAEVIKKSRGMK